MKQKDPKLEYHNRKLWKIDHQDVTKIIKDNVTPMEIFKSTFTDKYSLMRIIIIAVIPYLVILLPFFLIFYSQGMIKEFVYSAIFIAIVYFIGYFVRYERIFQYFNWTLVRKKKFSSNSNRKIVDIENGVTKYSDDELSKPTLYLTLSLDAKMLLENTIVQTYQKLNDILGKIEVPYTIIADKNGMFIQCDDLEAIETAFNTYNEFKLSKVSYTTQINFNNYKNYQYNYRNFTINGKVYKWVFVNINKLEPRVNLADIATHPGVSQVMLFNKKFVITNQIKRTLANNTNNLLLEKEKSNIVNASYANAELNNTVNLLDNLANNEIGLTSSTMLIIYEAKQKDEIKKLFNKYTLTKLAEYTQALTLLETIATGNVYSSKILDVISSYHISKLLLTDLKMPRIKTDNDFLLGYSQGQPFYFNNIDTGKDHPLLAPNRNMMIIGTSGSGKSVTMRKLVAYNNSRDIRCILIDPNNEIKMIANSEDFDISTSKFNLIQLSSDKSVDYEENIEDKVAFLVSVFKLIINISEADIILDTELKNTIKSFYTLHKSPQLQTFEMLFRHSSTINDKVREYLHKISRMIEGNSKIGNLFSDNASALEFKGQNILFPLKQYIKADKKLETFEDKIIILTMFYLVDKFIEKQSKKGEHSMVYIDEAHNFFKAEYLPYLQKMVKELRKWKSGIVFLTQNFKDLFQSEMKDTIQSIFSTCAHKFVLKVDGGDINTAIQNRLFGELLTEDTKTLVNAINYLDTGEIIYFENDIHHIDARNKDVVTGGN